MAPRREREGLALSKEDLVEAWSHLSMEDRTSLLGVIRGEEDDEGPSEEPTWRYSRLPRCEGLRFNLSRPDDPSVEAFVSQLKRFFVASRIPGASSFAVCVAGLHLEGEATVAWQDQVGGLCESLEDWCIKLLERARPVSQKTLAGLKFLKMVKLDTETMEGFVLKFNTRLGQLDVQDVPRLKFVLGCPDWMRPELLAVTASGADGLREVQNKAIMLASLKTVAAGPGSVSGGSPRLDVQAKMSKLPGFRGRCFKCGEMGHKSTECPKLDKKR